MQPVKISDEDFGKLKERFPEPDNELVKVTMRAGDVVLRNPTEMEWRGYTTQLLDKSMEAAALRNMLVQLCVFPDAGTFQKQLARFPAMATSKKLATAVSYLGGALESLEGKD